MIFDGTVTSVRYYRKIIKIRAEDSPNVRAGLAQQRRGEEPDNRIIVPGVLTWAEYKKRRATWDKIRQCVGLDADFYAGAEILLFPPEWLNASASRARELAGQKREAKAIGIDPAEGGDKTSMCAVDDHGLIELVSKKTPDTSVITSEALAFMRRHNVSPDRVCFDRGGGGKQHADRLRDQGYNVATVAFGESIAPDPRRGLATIEFRKEQKEERYTYVNRRAEMYGELSLMLDPSLGEPFAIPDGATGNPADPQSELRHQLAPIPKMYDGEGRLKMLPKHNPTDPDDPRTLVKLIGHSPDEADALVIALHAMRMRPARAKVFAY